MGSVGDRQVPQTRWIIRAEGRRSRTDRLHRLSGAQSSGVEGCCRCWRDMGSCGQVVSHPVPPAKRQGSEPENSRSRNGRRACRLSADEYATMHLQCSKGPRPGMVPGTRAFDGGGVEVICTGRVKGEARLVAGQRDLSRARCTLLRQHDNFAAGQLQRYIALLCSTASAAMLLSLQILEACLVPTDCWQMTLADFGLLAWRASEALLFSQMFLRFFSDNFSNTAQHPAAHRATSRSGCRCCVRASCWALASQIIRYVPSPFSLLPHIWRDDTHATSFPIRFDLEESSAVRLPFAGRLLLASTVV